MFVHGFDCDAGECFAELGNEAVDNTGHGIFFPGFAERIADDDFFHFPVSQQFA